MSTPLRSYSGNRRVVIFRSQLTCRESQFAFLVSLFGVCDKKAIHFCLLLPILLHHSILPFADNKRMCGMREKRCS